MSCILKNEEELAKKRRLGDRHTKQRGQYAPKTRGPRKNCTFLMPVVQHDTAI